MKKTNTIKHSGRYGVYAIILSVLAITAIFAIAFGYTTLRDIWREQCLIKDYENQVTIQSGKMVKADVIAGEFGLLKPGANLATIDYEKKRDEILKKIPNLKRMTISRKLPDRVIITTEERVPIARLEIKGRNSKSGKVVDNEGIVFECYRGTDLLPIIREKSSPGTAKGHRLSGRALAALQLVEACRDPQFQELGVKDIDVSPLDFLLASLNTGVNYAQLKLAWEGMDEGSTPASRASLIRQLTHLRDALRTHVGDGAPIWNATDFSSPGRIYADTKGKL